MDSNTKLQKIADKLKSQALAIEKLKNEQSANQGMDKDNDIQTLVLVVTKEYIEVQVADDNTCNCSRRESRSG